MRSGDDLALPPKGRRLLATVFFDGSHELRSGWKLLLYLVILIAAFFIGGLIASFFIVNAAVIDENQIASLGIGVAVQLFAAVAALGFMAKFVDRKPIATFGLSLRNWRREFLFGMAVAVLMLIATILGSMAFGDLDIKRNTMSTWGAVGLMALVLLGAAAFEELVFRGYPMQALIKGIGAWPAAAFMSILFGLAHANNPNATTLGIINTILAGILLSVGYLKTRSLWLPYGLHFAWNAGLGLILGFSLSGIDTASIWTTTTRGPEVVLGGAYGPEGGLVGAIAFGGALALVGLWKNRNSIQEIQ